MSSRKRYKVSIYSTWGKWNPVNKDHLQKNRNWTRYWRRIVWLTCTWLNVWKRKTLVLSDDFHFRFSAENECLFSFRFVFGRKRNFIFVGIFVYGLKWKVLFSRPLVEVCGSGISSTRPVPVPDYAYLYPYPTRAENCYPTRPDPRVYPYS